ncbi:uncharacterized protein FOMMEDRAFT_22258 [Fomitiporia mediterranea MF3/22]|uniref:uncharacterized protein n=1 Tax=Fomitiporia mediterranea (strain MF3/22) TaxID=694068 RepID=UPI000440827B|nr:uncharacterized protein FOMMEDRAFT_22258 [Fomitiporia mediterranea MF3/22]EJD00467.1 hypothetical protein FOMMEDRAFT_22258 [Fomitiporia mediterranea MF3/22]
MKLFTASFVLLAFLQGGLGASLSRDSVKSRGLTACPSAVAVNSSTVSVNGHDIQRTTFQCPDDSLVAKTNERLLSERSPVSEPDSLIELKRRSTAECRTAAPECQCGQPTTCTCVSTTPNAPNGNDCAILIDTLRVIPQVEGATFVVQPRTFQLLQFESCGIEFSNLGTGRNPTALEYCWDEEVALMGLSNEDCLESGVSTGASCNPTDGLWNLQILRIGS